MSAPHASPCKSAKLRTQLDSNFSTKGPFKSLWEDVRPHILHTVDKRTVSGGSRWFKVVTYGAKQVVNVHRHIMT